MTNQTMSPFAIEYVAAIARIAAPAAAIARRDADALRAETTIARMAAAAKRNTWTNATWNDQLRFSMPAGDIVAAAATAIVPRARSQSRVSSQTAVANTAARSRLDTAIDAKRKTFVPSKSP